VAGIAALERASALDTDNPVFLTDLATAQLGQRDEAGYARTRTRLAQLSPGALSLLDQRLQSCAGNARSGNLTDAAC